MVKINPKEFYRIVNIRTAKKQRFLSSYSFDDQKRNKTYFLIKMQTMTIQLYNSSYLHDGIMLKKKNGKIVQKHKSCWQHISCFLFWKHRSHGHHSHFKVFQIKVYFLKSTSVSKFCTFSDFKDQGTYTFCFTTPSQFS